MSSSCELRAGHCRHAAGRCCSTAALVVTCSCWWCGRPAALCRHHAGSCLKSLPVGCWTCRGALPAVQPARSAACARPAASGGDVGVAV